MLISIFVGDLRILKTKLTKKKKTEFLLRSLGAILRY